MKEIVCEQTEDSEYRFTRDNSTLGIRPCDFGAEKEQHFHMSDFSFKWTPDLDS